MMPEDYFVCPSCKNGFCGPGPTCDWCQKLPHTVPRLTVEKAAMMKVHDVRETVLSQPATVPRNFDANGTPCDAPCASASIEIRRTVLLVRPLEFIPISALLTD